MGEGYTTSTTNILSVNSIKKSVGYEFSKEDPAIYNDYRDPDNFTPKRHWPEVDLYR